jgi:hypothetical protein
VLSLGWAKGLRKCVASGGGGTGAQPRHIMAYLGLTNDGLLLDQYSWQVEMGVPGRRDATGLSGQTVPISVDMPFHEREGVASGPKLRISCGQ